MENDNSNTNTQNINICGNIYRNTKCQLAAIIRDKNNISILFDAVLRTHNIVIHTYQFLRLWILSKYKKGIEIPTITEDIIDLAFSALSLRDNRGGKYKGDKLVMLNEFNKFYDDEYKKLNYYDKFNGSLLGQILTDMATDIKTSIENNIKLNFISYVKRFVNSSFKKQHNDILDKYNRNDKVSMRKQLNKDLHDIKEDLFNDTLNSDNKYHEWINNNRKNILPSEYKNSYEFDIENNPQRYLKYMIYMCIEIEKLGTKSFQFFPLRTNIIPKYMPIDTTTLIYLLVNKPKKDKNIKRTIKSKLKNEIQDESNVSASKTDPLSQLLQNKTKRELLEHVEDNKYLVWNTFFKLDFDNESKNRNIFKGEKSYKFDYKIATDCFSASVQLIRKDQIEANKKKHNNMKNAKIITLKRRSGMSEQEKDADREKVSKEKKDAEIEYNLKIKQQKDKERDDFKKLSKEEQKQKRIENKLNRIKLDKKNGEQKEFPYLEELTDSQYDELKKSDIAVTDPGKKCLLYMKGLNQKEKMEVEDEKILKYTNRKHIKRTKRVEYQKKIQKYKDKEGISKEEDKLKDKKSKSCEYEKFADYIKKKNEVNLTLMEKYKEKIFRQYDWYSYINRKRAETNLISEIKEKFGEKVKIIMGDWSDKSSSCRVKYISTPNIGLKRKLGEYFTIYNIDEYRTSCLHHKTEEKCENLYLPDKKGNMRKIHSVLTYKTESNRLGCINRDNNAVENMKKIVRSYLKDKKRPEKYCRNYVIEKSMTTTDSREMSYRSCEKESIGCAQKKETKDRTKNKKEIYKIYKEKKRITN